MAARRNAVLKTALFLALLGIISFQLWSIGLSNIVQALPRTPWFYALAAIGYLALPVSDTQIYALIWRLPRRALLAATLRKRVLNESILGYSGEAYFCLWTAKRLGMSHGRAFGNVRDVNLLSALTSTLVATLLVVWLASCGRVENLGALLSHPAFKFGVPAILLASLLAVGLNIRFKLGLLSADLSARVLMYHGLRLLLVSCLLLAQWSVAQPDISISIWMGILAAQMVVTRIPMLPNQELLLVGVGIGMAGAVNIPSEAIAALFLASGATTLLLHLLVYLITTLVETCLHPTALPNSGAGANSLPPYRAP